MKGKADLGNSQRIPATAAKLPFSLSQIIGRKEVRKQNRESKKTLSLRLLFYVKESQRTGNEKRRERKGSLFLYSRDPAKHG